MRSDGGRRAAAVDVGPVRSAARAFGVMGVLYVGGAMLYGFRVPERFFAGRFDVFGSHAVWHLCVVGAALMHFVAVTEHRAWRGANLACDGY